MRKKIFITLLALVCVLCCMFSLVACSLFGNKEPDEHALPAPKNVSFDKDTYTLSWDKVDNAVGYTISYNDSVIHVDADKTSEQVFITAEQNSFKVKAVGDGVEYVDSGWSKEVKYNIELNSEQLTVYEKVNIQLAKIAKEEDLELQKVIGISYVNTERFDNNINIRFETLCEKGNALNRVPFSFVFNKQMTDIKMIKTLDTSSKVWVYEGEIVNYNSAQFMLDGNALDGKMAELKEQGYNLSVVDSVVTKGKIVGTKFIYDIVGTYKAEKGEEIKYFTNIIHVQMNQVSTNEKTNYEQSLLVPQRYTVKETAFVMHEGTMEYMGELVKRLPLSVRVDGINYSIISGTATLIRPDSNTITEVNIPASFTWQNNVYTVTSIAEDAFNSQWIASITVDENNAYYASHDGLLYNKTKTRLLHVPHAIEGEVTILNGVTSIEDNAFESCHRMTSITIPSSITSIGSDAFNYCTGLTSVTIPNGVTGIGSYAFYHCENLTSITIPNSVTSIGDHVFDNCYRLASIELPDGVTSIGDEAFRYCTGLTSITIPNSVTRILDSQFSHCSELTSIKFNGTKAQWKEIKTWYRDNTVGEYIVTCTDGKLDKNGNEITE